MGKRFKKLLCAGESVIVHAEETMELKELEGYKFRLRPVGDQLRADVCLPKGGLWYEFYWEGFPTKDLAKIPNEHRISVLDWVQLVEADAELDPPEPPPLDEPTGSKARQLTPKRVKQLIDGGEIVMVDFTSEYCGPCQEIGPIMDTLDGYCGARVVKVDVDGDAASEWADSLGLSAVPTVVIWKRGEVVDCLVGERGAGTYQRALRRLQ